MFVFPAFWLFGLPVTQHVSVCSLNSSGSIFNLQYERRNFARKDCIYHFSLLVRRQWTLNLLDACSYHKAAVKQTVQRERWLWWCQRESSGLAGRKATLCHPPPHPHSLILQQATGQVSRHWLHLLHLGCLAFFSSPKWSCKFHVAGRVTDWEMGASKWEIRRGPGTSKLHNGLSPADTGLACQLSPSIWKD